MSEAPRGPMAILRDIQEKTLDAKLLGTADRRVCVEYLLGEGYSVPHIAELLKRTTRTVQRDVHEIRENHSVTASPELQRQMIGQLLLDGQQGIARLRKIGRDRATPPATQVEAELGAWQILKELIELMQSLGLLPLAAQELRADIHHLVEELPSLEKMQKVVMSIEQACGNSDGTKNVLVQLSAVKGLLAQATAASVLEDLKEQAAGESDADK